MVDKKTWEEFRKAGLLWWVNMILHTFGWSICIELDDDSNVINAYPARVKFRGFGEKDNTAGYTKVSEYLEENVSELVKESKE